MINGLRLTWRTSSARGAILVTLRPKVKVPSFFRGLPHVFRASPETIAGRHLAIPEHLSGALISACLLPLTHISFSFS